MKSPRLDDYRQSVTKLRFILKGLTAKKHNTLVASILQKHRTNIVVISILTLAQSSLEAFSLVLVFAGITQLSQGQASAPALNPAVDYLHATLNAIGASSSNVKVLAIALAIFFVQCLQVFANYNRTILAEQLAAKTKELVVNQIHSNLVAMRYEDSLRYSSGTLVTMASDCPEAVKQEIIEIFSFLSSVFNIAAYLYVVVTISWKLLLFGVIIFSLTAGLQLAPSRQIKRVFAELSSLSTRINQKLTDDVRSLKHIKISRQESLSHKLLTSYTSQLITYTTKQAVLAQSAEAKSRLLNAASLCLIMSLSVFLLGPSSYMLAGLTTFLLSVQRMKANILTATRSLTNIAACFGKLELLEGILSEHSSNRTVHPLITVDKFSLLSLERVSYTYPSMSNAAILDVSLSIKANELVAFVGTSGSGKTTIIDLLTGILAPQEGKVCISTPQGNFNCLDCYYLLQLFCKTLICHR